MKQSSPRRLTATSFQALSDEEKEAVYRECERLGATDGEPLNARERREWNGLRRRGRPRKGAGAEVLSVSMERGLLHAADAYARRHKISRSELASRGVRAVLVAGGAA